MALSGNLRSLDPAGDDDNMALQRITPLLYDTLVREDGYGGVQSSLARTWSSEDDSRRWQFWLRPGVHFHDGAPLTAAIAATALSGAVPGCKTRPVGDSVIFECEAAQPALDARLASPRTAIVRRFADGHIDGTGPFSVAEFQPGTRAVLRAVDDAWSGRPYVDEIAFTFGQSSRDQLLSLEVGRADLVELAPGQAEAAGVRSSTPAPSELIAIVFARTSSSAADERMRRALSLAVDRAAISQVLLQGSAEPAGGLLPGWLTGYASLFSVSHDVSMAGRLRAASKATAPITLAAPTQDAELRTIAERVALNARDAGFAVQLAEPSSSADAYLVRVHLASLNPAAALSAAAERLRLAAPVIHDDSPQAAFDAERALISGGWVVPLVFESRPSGLSTRVRNWAERRDDAWRLADVWLTTPGSQP